MKMINIKKKKQFGVSIFEFVLLLAIILAIVPIVIYQIYSFNQKRDSQEYAKQTVAYAKAFARYLHDYKAVCGSAITMITFENLRDQHYLPVGVRENTMEEKKYGRPRVACRDDNTHGNGAIQAVMYYVKNDYSSGDRQEDVKKMLFAKDAADDMKGAAGIYQFGNEVTSTNGAWTVDKSFFVADKGKIPENSVVVNLAMLPEFSAMLVAPSQSSGSNDANQYNKNANTNTLFAGVRDFLFKPAKNGLKSSSAVDKDAKTDRPVIKYHSIKFAADEKGAVLTSSMNTDYSLADSDRKNSTLLLTGSLGAQGIIPISIIDSATAKNIGDSCSHEGELIAISGADKTLLANSGVFDVNVAVCRHSRSNYGSCGDGLCYAPIGNITRTRYLDSYTRSHVACTETSLLGSSAKILKYPVIESSNSLRFYTDTSYTYDSYPNAVMSELDKPLTSITCSFEPINIIKK